MDWQAEGEDVKLQYEDVYVTNNRVVRVSESFSSFSSESISLDHLSVVFAYKKRRVWLIVAGVVLMVLFTALYLLNLIGTYGFNIPPVVSTLEETFLGVDVLGIILVILGLILGPKAVAFEADSGSMIAFEPSNASEIEEVLQWFGILQNQKPAPPA